jgi:hypothetical protein
MGRNREKVKSLLFSSFFRLLSTLTLYIINVFIFFIKNKYIVGESVKYKLVLVILLSITLTTCTFVNVSSKNIENFEENIIIDNQLSSGNQIEKPEWFKGHFWEYQMLFNFDLSVIGHLGVAFDAIINNLVISVDDIDETNNKYILKLIGDASGDFIANGAKAGELNGITGYAYIQIDNLAMKEFYLSFLVTSFAGVQFDFFFKIVFNPAFDYFGFPLYENEDPWDVETTASIALGGSALGNEFRYEDIEDKTLATTMSLKQIEEIIVPAGKYNSYNISGTLGEKSELWYAPNAGNFVQLYENLLMKVVLYDAGMVEFEGDLTTNYEMKLIRTNFNLDNKPPHTPESPSGNNQGTPGEEYSYSTSTIEPDGDRVYYLFDWGDGSDSDWIGPKNSGEIASATHSWNEKGDYQIKVKAKDEHGLETTWSDPMAVTMPKSRQIFCFRISELLSCFPNILSLFRLLSVYN